MSVRFGWRGEPVRAECVVLWWWWWWWCILDQDNRPDALAAYTHAAEDPWPTREMYRRRRPDSCRWQTDRLGLGAMWMFQVRSDRGTSLHHGWRGELFQTETVPPWFMRYCEISGRRSTLLTSATAHRKTRATTHWLTCKRCSISWIGWLLSLYNHTNVYWSVACIDWYALNTAILNLIYVTHWHTRC